MKKAFYFVMLIACCAGAASCGSDADEMVAPLNAPHWKNGGDSICEDTLRHHHQLDSAFIDHRRHHDRDSVKHEFDKNLSDSISGEYKHHHNHGNHNGNHGNGHGHHVETVGE